MNIVLVGLMGSGKTSVGRLLARRLGRPLIDTDWLIAQEAGCSIPEIFAAEGEAGFRDREARVIARVAAADGQVVATGGGAVLRPENREALRGSGLVIWLEASPEALYERTRLQGIAQRPLLASDDPLGRLRSLAQARAGAYAAAAHCAVKTDGRSVETVVADILEILKERGWQLG